MSTPEGSAADALFEYDAYRAIVPLERSPKYIYSAGLARL